MDNKKHINIENLCSLCRLSLSVEESAALEKDLESIIAFAKEVEKADTISVADGGRSKNVLRADIPEDKNNADYTSIAERSCKEYFCVPKAVD